MDLQHACRLPFEELPGVMFVQDQRRYKFIDNNKSVLFVAHTDFIKTLNSEMVLNELAGQPVVFSSALDDRLGMWLGLEQLQDYCDILLTEDEEVGKSTADMFQPPRAYNWMLSLDRRGVDEVAMYQYLDAQSDTVTAWLSENGISPIRGSNSCIADLDHLGIMGFNFSVGYHQEHSYLCHAFVSDIDYAFAKARRFVEAFAGVVMPYAPKPEPTLSNYQYGFYGSEAWCPTAATTMSPFVDYCDECKELWELNPETLLCEVCTVQFGGAVSRGDYAISRFYKFKQKVEFFSAHDVDDVRWWGPCLKCKKITELEYTTKRCKRCCQKALHFKPILGTKEKKDANLSIHSTTPELPTLGARAVPSQPESSYAQTLGGVAVV